MNFNIFNHPATQFICRHCGKNAGYDPEMCYYCGPVCIDCWNDPQPCKGELKHKQKIEAEQPMKVKKAK